MLIMIGNRSPREVARERHQGRFRRAANPGSMNGMRPWTFHPLIGLNRCRLLMNDPRSDSTPFLKNPSDLEVEYKSIEPIRAFFRLLRLNGFQHAFLVLLHGLKMAPMLLLPILIAESIRIAQSDLNNPWERLLLIYGIYGLILLSNLPLHMWFVHWSSRATRNMELRLRASLVRRLQHLSMHFHGERESGRLQSKVLRDVEQIVRFSELYFTAVLGAFLSILFSLIYTLVQEPVVVLGYLIAAPVAIGLIQLFRRVMRRRNDALRQDFEGMSQRVSEMIDMVPVTRAHGVEEFELASVHELLKHVQWRGRQVDLVNAFFNASAFVVMIGSVVLVTGGVSYLVLFHGVGIDKIALYAALFQMVVGATNQLLSQIPQFARSMASIRSLGEILECPDLEENEGKRVLERVEGYIDFRNVSFTYPGQEIPAVSEFTLSVRPGDCVAFVGESGSGKSTLMQLTIGFLRNREGQILLDGHPMETLDMRSWRRHIAMVPQQTILFSGTLEQNISYGLEHYTREDMLRAIDVANLTRVVEALPRQLETPVGENGLKLSGGQRQRLAIARAVIRNPRVIILDEATSALDVISEREVQIAIENLIKGRTTFIVAHRLSTIRQATRVVVMDKGRMIETGSPLELEKNQGVFASLKALQ